MRRSLLHFLLSLGVAVIAAAPVLTLRAGQPAPDFSASAIPPSAATVNVTDAQFAGGAVGDLRTCADMQMTSGSATLYSPSQCNFASGDVGKWVQVPFAGDAYGTGLSAQISGFTDSQHVTLGAMAGATVTAATVSYTDLVIATPNTGVSSVGHTFTPDQVGLVLTIASGTGFTPGNYTITSVAYSGIATLSGAAGTSGSTSGTGSLALAGSVGTGNYAALTAVATYACANPGTTVNFPAGAYYIEKYKIMGGGNANGVTDIVWNGCSGVTATGYGASVSSNGSYRQIQDSDGFLSYEQTVSPFHVTMSTMTIEGLEVNGNVENTTQAANIAEGRSHGIVTDSSTVTLLDVNSHGFPADCVELGLNSVDTNDVMTNVWVHDCGRQGLTVANVAGLTATNYQCEMIGAGFTGGYGGHSPEDCIDIEPAIAPAASGIVFTGGYLANAVGALIDTTPGSDTTLTLSGITWACSMSGVTSQTTCANGGMGQPVAVYTIISGNTLDTLSCGPSYPSPVTSTITNNTIIVQGFDGISCSGSQNHFSYNNITVSGTVQSTHYLYFRGDAVVSHNTFWTSKNAQFNSIYVNQIQYTGTVAVFDNTYSTDMTNAAYPYTVDYTGVNLACGEVSQEPKYFVVTGGTLPCPGTGTRSGGNTLGGGASVH